MVDGAEFDAGARPELRWLPVARLRVDDRYQRTFESRASQALIKTITENFNWSAFGVVVVAPADDGWVVIDGQHRLEGARRRGLEEVPAVIVLAADVAEQARIFVAANRDRVAMNPFAMHHAQLQAGDPGALEVLALCEATGLSIPRYPLMSSRLKAGQTLALATLRRTLALHGRAVAELALCAVANAYGTRPAALRAVLLRCAVDVVAAAQDRDAAAVALQGFLARVEPDELFAGVRSEMAAARINEQTAIERALLRGIGTLKTVAVTSAEPVLVARAPPPPSGLRKLATAGMDRDERAYDEHRLRRLVAEGSPIARIAEAFKISEAEVRRRAAAS